MPRLTGSRFFFSRHLLCGKCIMGCSNASSLDASAAEELRVLFLSASRPKAGVVALLGLHEASELSAAAHPHQPFQAP